MKENVNLFEIKWNNLYMSGIMLFYFKVKFYYY